MAGNRLDAKQMSALARLWQIINAQDIGNKRALKILLNDHIAEYDKNWIKKNPRGKPLVPAGKPDPPQRELDLGPIMG